jgi:hypothetical protein
MSTVANPHVPEPAHAPAFHPGTLACDHRAVSSCDSCRTTPPSARHSQPLGRRSCHGKRVTRHPAAGRRCNAAFQRAHGMSLCSLSCREGGEQSGSRAHALGPGEWACRSADARQQDQVWVNHDAVPAVRFYRRTEDGRFCYGKFHADPQQYIPGLRAFVAPRPSASGLFSPPAAERSRGGAVDRPLFAAWLGCALRSGAAE